MSRFYWQVKSVLRFSSTNKTSCHDITEILLIVPLNTITLTLILKLTNISPWWLHFFHIKGMLIAQHKMIINIAVLSDEIILYVGF